MLKKNNIFRTVFIMVLLIGIHISIAGANSLDGTRGDQEQPNSSWLRSVSPCFYNNNPDGSINYSATHISPTAWAINWGNCDIHTERATFSALGILYSVIIYNHNEPYTLVSTDWSPSLSYSSNAYEGASSFIAILFPLIFGNGF